MEDRPVDGFRKCVTTPEPPRLGPHGRPGTLAVPEIERRLETFFQDTKIARSIQPLLRSAALLWHDHLDASHSLSQGIETRDGSWLHGIMHRREPDYGNAKYWFRRVGPHEAFPDVAERVAALLPRNGSGNSTIVVKNGEWQPLAFVDECEQAESGGNAEEQLLLRQVQAAEFDVLVEHIFGLAAG